MVRRTFRTDGVEGERLYKVACTLPRERVPTSTGKQAWSEIFIRKVIKQDVYKPNTVKEIAKIASLQVAARLDPEKQYGLVMVPSSWGHH